MKLILVYFRLKYYLTDWKYVSIILNEIFDL